MISGRIAPAYPLPAFALEAVGLSFAVAQAELETAATLIARAFALAALTIILATAATATLATNPPPALRDHPGRADTRPVAAITPCPAAGHPICWSN